MRCRSFAGNGGKPFSFQLQAAVGVCAGPGIFAAGSLPVSSPWLPDCLLPVRFLQLSARNQDLSRLSFAKIQTEMFLLDSRLMHLTGKSKLIFDTDCSYCDATLMPTETEGKTGVLSG
jgi:hypothetical protein